VRRDIPPGATMFERLVVCVQDHLEIGRRYIQAFGLTRGVGALVDDMNEGRQAWEKGQYVLGHVPYLVIEYVARRVGFTRFSSVYMDPEFTALQMNSLSRVFQCHSPFPEQRYVRALEEFAWRSLRHWHLVAHDMGGRHLYEVTPSLAHLLRLPELLERPWRAPRLPVPSLLLLVPPEAGLALTVEGFPPRAVTEMYAVESPPPKHQWSVWLHAPVDEYFAESVYLEMLFFPDDSLEEGLERAHDMFVGGAPVIQGWKESVRWLAASMRYLAEGGTRQECRPHRPEMNPGRRILLGAADALH
jgi:hypothetical protein